MYHNKWWFFFLAVILLAGCSKPTLAPLISSAEPESSQGEQAVATPRVFTVPTSTPPGRELTAEDRETFEQNQMIGRGINLIVAPPDSAGIEDGDDSGVVADEKYFKAIKDAGFDSVNFPVAWSYLAQVDPPYQIDSTAFEEMDNIVNQLLDLDLTVILYFGGYEELQETPRLHKERFLEIWDQVADHYKNFPDNLFFGIYFFPGGTMAAANWNEYANEAITTIRQTNPDRILLLGPGDFGPPTFIGFQLPENDRKLILTFSYFSPFQFTVQGLDEFTEEWIGTTWSGTEEETKMMTSNMDQAAKYSQQLGRPVNITAFGCSNLADDVSRSRWLSAVTSLAEERSISWSFFAFVNGPLSAYDLETDTWDQTILQALIPE